MNAQNPSALAFVACGRLLFGAHYKAPLADVLGLRVDTVDAMGKGRSRIPEGVWLEVAGLLQDREKDLPLLKLKALEFANQQMARTYRVDGSAEFGVRPAPDGRWYTIEYSTTWPIELVGKTARRQAHPAEEHSGHSARAGWGARPSDANVHRRRPRLSQATDDDQCGRFFPSRHRLTVAAALAEREP